MKFNSLLFTIATLGCGQFLSAQTLLELYENRDYEALTAESKNAKNLSTDELYYVGYAFFQLENDKKAIEMYNMAIAKGLDDENIHLYKGLALRYDKQFEKAIASFRTAIQRNPTSQKSFTELGNSFYFQEQFDSALFYFYKARALEYSLGDPYLKIPNIYHLQGNYEKALEEYEKSASLINNDDPTYLELLQSIGLLQYTVFKNYEKSIDAYAKLITAKPTGYTLYPKLIKAYYANEQFEEGNSLIANMKQAYENEELPEEYQKFGNVPVAEFAWKEQKVAVYKYFKTPTETLDLMYKMYVLSPDGKSVERTLMIEKTLQIGEGGAKHLLCERKKSGTHITYAYGWATDDIDFPSLKKATLAVLDKELKPAASSKINTERKKKRK